MYYLIYRDVSNQWRWTLYAANGRKIANSGEGYFNKADCEHGLQLTATSGNVTVRYA